MNVAALSSILLALGVFAYGLILTSGVGELKLFYDTPSLFIVFGGVVAAAALSFQYKKTLKMLKVGVLRFVKSKSINYQDLIAEILKAVDLYRNGESLKSISEKSKDEFLKECIQLIDNEVMSFDDALVLMNDRNDNIYYLYNEDSGKLKTLGKYPPAFGMMGTTMGMIVLLANLSGADAIKKVGPAMGICLITTLYGTVMANFIFLPLADNLNLGAKEIYLKNKIIIEGVKCLSQKLNPIVVAEKLNSFLLPSDRMDWKKVLRG